MFTTVKLATQLAWVKPTMAWQRDNQSRRTRNSETGSRQEGTPAHYLNHSNRPVRTRMPGGVAGAQPSWLPPMPILPLRILIMDIDVAPLVPSARRLGYDRLVGGVS